jgi:hypothetical protein
LRSRPAETIRSGRLYARFSLALICIFALPAALAQDAAAGAKADGSHSSATAQSHHRRSKWASSKHRVARGQQKIDPERALEIQKALIREHYLSGVATGTWNQTSEDAMRRFQADHGWQSKTVPDSRALISLGLGPSHDHLLNPESAMTSEPRPARPTSSAASLRSASSQRTSNEAASSEAASTHATSSPSSASSAPADKAQPDPAPMPQSGAGDQPRPQ